MNQKEYVLDSLKRTGMAAAKALQEKAESMTGTELYAEGEYIPDFRAACAKQNMLERPIGFVCRSSAGRMVKLLQPYDSTIYTQEPEELPAQWGFKWSTDPKDALPFVAISTSPYNTGECCTEDGKTFRSKMDGNVHAPSAYPQGWEEVTQ
jgi:hypothetical protein